MKAINSLVSIIVPVYNCEEFLSTCLDSIINQSYKNLEIILINDGSSDNSLSICKDYQKKDSRIIVINNKNSGVSFTRNCGFKNSTGEYICFIDSDDWIDTNYVTNLISSLKDANSDVSFCNYYASFNKHLEEERLEYSNDDSYIEILLKNNFWSPWGKLYKKSIITNLFDENVSSSEDLLFNFMNNKNIKSYSHIDDFLYFYRRKDDSKFTLKEVGIKQTSELDTLIYIIENSTNYVRDFVICHYINILHRIIYYDKKTKPATFNNKEYYLKKAKTFYKKNLNKSKISFKKRVKNFLMMYFSSIYYMILDVQIKNK